MSSFILKVVALLHRQHCFVVEGLACPHDPWRYVVGGFAPLQGSPMALRKVLMTGHTKSGSEAPRDDTIEAGYVSMRLRLVLWLNECHEAVLTWTHPLKEDP